MPRRIRGLLSSVASTTWEMPGAGAGRLQAARQRRRARTARRGIGVTSISRGRLVGMDPAIRAIDVRAAAERIRPLARKTPVLTSELFDAEAGVSTFFKCENLQRG